jgi:L-amino acid N-acyltransferase YncA
MEIRNMQANDWTAVAAIYEQGIQTGNATFQQSIPNWSDWDKGHLNLCRLIAEKDGIIVGWAALSPVSARAVYRGVCEVSVYIDTQFRGQKVGQKILFALISESEKNDIWTLQSSIFAENKPSIHIHELTGFRQIGYREKIGKMNGIWRDTLLFERRSQFIGI